MTLAMSRNLPLHRLSPAARRLRMLRVRQEPSQRVEKQQSELIAELLHSAAIETVFDIHPHSCAVGITLRQAGYQGRIVTFEPDHHVWEQLRYCSMTDERWVISRSAIRRQEEVIVSSNEHFPLIGTRVQSAIEVFCDEGETLAVWLSQPEDVELLEDAVACPQVRVLNLACTIVDMGNHETTIETALTLLRQAHWEVIAVNTRPPAGRESTATIADVLAVRVPSTAW